MAWAGKGAPRNFRAFYSRSSLQKFTMPATTGIIKLSPIRALSEPKATLLNVRFLFQRKGQSLLGFILCKNHVRWKYLSQIRD